MMDARIQNEQDLQKLVHCEILKAEHGIVNGTIALCLVLRSLDETVFQLFIVPGVETALNAGTAHIKPNILYITKEVLYDEARQDS